MLFPFLAGIVVFIRSSKRDPFERVLLALLAPAMGVALWVICFCVVDFGVDDWSGAKLAPIAAMMRGYRLYQDPNTGVMTGWIYGPVSALLFLPATFFHRPTPALICGSLISLLCTMLPAVWILIQSARRNWLAALLGVCLFLVFCITHQSLRLAIFQIGPDGPALGFAAASIALLVNHRNRWMHLIFAALLASLAVWSKQTLLPFLCVGPVYFAATGNRKTAARLAMLTLAALAVLSLVFTVVVGPISSMWFHMVHLPASHSWVTRGPTVVWTLLGILGELLADCSEAIVILLLILFIPRQRGGSNAWILLTMAAVVGVPGAVLGYVKVGGDINNFALTTYYLSLAVASLLTRTIASVELPERLGVLLRSGVCLLVVVAIGLIASNPGKLYELPQRLANPSDNLPETAYQYLKQHADEAYFPWNPLAAVLAQGKLYHFEWGMIDRYLADPASMAPQNAEIFAHMPPRSRIVAIPQAATTKFALRFFSTYAQAAPDPRLPGFQIFTAPNQTGDHAP